MAVEGAALVGNWMPAGVAVFFLLIACTALWNVFSRRLDKIELKLETLLERLPLLAEKTSLGNLGDRFDKRVGKLSERVRVIEVITKTPTDRSDDEDR
jgi:hypothetical protein